MIGKNGKEYIRLSINGTTDQTLSENFICLGERMICGPYTLPNYELVAFDIPIPVIEEAINEEKKRDGVKQ